ncbi:MAG: hypothetical protein HRT51_17695 [Colwellia sp.]|nr:hypothetical protein [Colwellia sp.]
MNKEIDIPEQHIYEGKATQKQKKLIYDLGFDEQETIDSLGKVQASELIDQLIFIQTKNADIAFYKKRALMWLAGVFAFLTMIAFGNINAEPEHLSSLVVWGLILTFCCFIGLLKPVFKLLDVKLRKK